MTTASASSCMGRKRRTGSKRQAALPDQCTPFRANISTKYPSRGVFLPSHRSVQSSVQSIRHGAYFYRHTVPCNHQYKVSVTGRIFTVTPFRANTSTMYPSRGVWFTVTPFHANISVKAPSRGVLFTVTPFRANIRVKSPSRGIFFTVAPFRANIRVKDPSRGVFFTVAPLRAKGSTVQRTA